MAGCSQPGPAVTVNIPLPPPPSPPGAPTVEYQVISAATANVTVKWSPVPGATYYKVFVNGSLATQVEGNTNTSVILQLQPGQTYQIAVAACN